ncbi:MAG: family 20 glycosylhydrolase [Eubacteriales bacterium]|nr:family 20 glycosylhydrolase [Eubacteriales bacterium]
MLKKNIILGEGRYITEETRLTGASDSILHICRAFGLRGRAQGGAAYREIRFLGTQGRAELEELSAEYGFSLPLGEEGHLILAQGDTVRVYGDSERGRLYGAVSLLRLTRGHSLPEQLFYSSPVCRLRGMKIFLPAREDIPFFQKFIDMLVYYKFNTVMIEVGGAMEYVRHPEINAAWVDYCREMGEYSGKTTEIQDRTFPWYKNAIHMENGGGSYLKQDQVRELADYCRQRQLEVIPEVPSLGHCDYLLLAHPELAERSNDPYPDAYCPSNPDTYKLLFDVLDEVLEVFSPRVVNIGHDEAYSIGVCERCRGRSGADLFAADVNRIADYLKARQVRTMLWGDKLLKDARVPDAGPFGGAEYPMYSPAFHREDGTYIGTMPATWQAIDQISSKTEILHWNWGLSAQLEETFLERGFPVFYGNFDSYLFPDWRAHMEKPIEGAMISNWSTLNERILQRNGIFFNIAYAYEMFWDPDYREEDFEGLRERVLDSLYRLKNPERDRCVPCPEDRHPDFLEFLYATDYHPDFQWFVDGVFPEDKKYRIGEIRLHYADHTSAVFPVIYGENIGYQGVSWERRRDDRQDMYLVDDHLYETTFTTRPVREKEQTFYRYLVRNPHPERELVHETVTVCAEKGCRIFVKDITRLRDGARKEARHDGAVSVPGSD